ncbi:MAG TPA: hypothetical protein VGF67_17690 [Ktedonobacteraceae bacterium]|jgi:hypothetical protein
MPQQRLFHRSAQEWRNFGIVLVTVVLGGALSFLAIPYYLTGIDPWVGFLAFYGIVSTCAYVRHDVRKSFRSLVGWTVGLLALAFIGASAGFVFLPSTLLLSSRLLFGALVGLALPGPLRAAYEEGVELQNKRLSKESRFTDQ